MNQAASHIGSGKELWGAAQNRGLLLAEGGRDKEAINKRGLFQARPSSPRGTVGDCQADYLTCADQELPANGLKVPLGGMPELQLGKVLLKCWFADVGLTTSDSILVLLFFFLNITYSRLSFRII